MDGRDHGRALAHRRRDPLDGAAAHIPNRENAFPVGCQGVAAIHAGHDKALVVEMDSGGVQPIGVGIRANEGKDMTSIVTGYQDIFMYGKWPDWGRLWPTALMAVLLCVLAMRLFRKHSGEMVDEL